MRIIVPIGVRYSVLVCIGVLLFASCEGRGQAKNVAVQDTCVFTLPTPPAVLTNVADRAEYVAEHYWQGLNYADTTWLGNSTALEQVFVDWIPVLAELSQDSRVQAAGTVITYGIDYPAMQLRLGELADLYFHEPNSPYRNEELYIPILRALIEAPHIEDVYKERYRYQLDKAMMNRPGTRAADFAFITREQRTQRLSDLRSDYVLLYFFNPDCNDCKRVTDYISASSVFSALLKDKRLTILALYPDEDLQAWDNHINDIPQEWVVARYAKDADREAYDLPAIPNLYLLDRDKNVILKDAPVELIENWLHQEMPEAI